MALASLATPAFATVAFAAEAAVAPANAVSLPRHETLTLTNGLEVVVVPFASPGLVAVYTVIRAGARDELAPGEIGVAHLLEHLLFRDTPRFTASARAHLEARLGVVTNAWTSEDATVFHSTGPVEALPQVLAIEADKMGGFSVDAATFRAEAGAVLGEYQKDRASPETMLEETLLGLAFSRHPYGHPIIGREANVRALPEALEPTVAFHRRYYRPDNALLVIAGPVHAEELRPELERSYAVWTGKSAPRPPPVEPPQTGERRTSLTSRSASLPRLLIAFRTPGALNVDAVATQLVLGGYLFGPTSALEEELVLARGVVDHLAGAYGPHRDPFLFSVTLDVHRARDLAAVEARTLAELRALAEGRVDTERLARVIANLRATTRLDLETVDAIAEAFVEARLIGDRKTPEALLAAVERVPSDALVRFAKENLVAKNRLVLTLVPRSR